MKFPTERLEFPWDLAGEKVTVQMMRGHESLVSIVRCYLSFPRPMLEKEPVLEVLSQVVEPSGESLMLLPFLLSTS